jgi:hypothetical protein
MSKGIDIRATTSELVFRAFLQSGSGADITIGTTALTLYELQMSDGTLKSYDFNDNTFKTTALTQPTGLMTHRQGNNSTVNTGIWTYRLATLTGFTAGNIYFAQVAATSAVPPKQTREFQFGSADGDLVVSGSRLLGEFSIHSGTAQAGGASSITLAAGASATTDFYKNRTVNILAGTGAGQSNGITAYNGTTKVATVKNAWLTQPDATSQYSIEAVTAATTGVGSTPLVLAL